jgi:hypothetical protein
MNYYSVAACVQCNVCLYESFYLFAFVVVFCIDSFRRVCTAVFCITTTIVRIKGG